MTELGKVAALCLVGVVLSLLLKKNTPELAFLLTLAVCAGALLLGLRRLRTILTVLEEMGQAGGVSGELLEPLVKTVGIAIITRIGSELCRDASQGAMASVVETAGACCAIVISIPLLRAVWELLRGML